MKIIFDFGKTSPIKSLDEELLEAKRNIEEGKKELQKTWDSVYRLTKFVFVDEIKNYKK